MFSFLKDKNIFLRFFFPKDFIYLFLERGEEREEEREKNMNVWLPLACLLPKTWPTTPACAQSGSQTGYTLIHRLALNPLGYTGQGKYVK